MLWLRADGSVVCKALGYVRVFFQFAGKEAETWGGSVPSQGGRWDKNWLYAEDNGRQMSSG